MACWEFPMDTIIAAAASTTATTISTAIDECHSGALRSDEPGNLEIPGFALGRALSDKRLLARGMTRFRASILDPISSLKDPPYHDHANDQERSRHSEAQGDADVGDLVETPAKAGDQVDHGIEQGDGAPARRQHVHRIEAAAEEGQRRHHQHRDHLQLLE